MSWDSTELRKRSIEQFWPHESTTEPRKGKATEIQIFAMRICLQVTNILIRGLQLKGNYDGPVPPPKIDFPDGKIRANSFFETWTSYFLTETDFYEKLASDCCKDLDAQSKLFNFEWTSELKVFIGTKDVKNLPIKDQIEFLSELASVLEILIPIRKKKRVPVQNHRILFPGINYTTFRNLIKNVNPGLRKKTEAYLLASLGIPLKPPPDDPRKKQPCSWCWLGIEGIAVLLIGFFLILRGDQQSHISFNDHIIERKWINYEPMNYIPYHKEFPEPGRMWVELKALAEDFDGLITFGCNGSLAEIPRIAKAVGFKTVIIGVEDPGDPVLVDIAITQDQWVDAYVLGHNYAIDTVPEDYSKIKAHIIGQIRKVQRMTGKPVSTTLYYDELHLYPEYLEVVDWIFPDIGGTWRKSKCDSTRQMDYMLREFDRFVEMAKQDIKKYAKPVMLKMISCPSGGDEPFDPAFQLRFFNEIKLRTNGRNGIGFPKTRVGLSYFGAWDTPWKCPGGPGPIDWEWQEGYAGLYDQIGVPKPAMQGLK